MGKLLETDFVPTGGAPGCELSGPPETPLVETPPDQASVEAVGPAPGEATPSVPDFRDARAAVEANLPPLACLADVDEGGGSVRIPETHPEHPPAGANAQAGGSGGGVRTTVAEALRANGIDPAEVMRPADDTIDAMLFGTAFFRNGVRVSPGEFIPMPDPPRVRRREPPSIHRNDAEGTTEIRLTTAKLVVDDGVIENLPFSPSPVLEALLRIQDEVRSAIYDLTGVNRVNLSPDRLSGYAGLFDGCRRVTAAEQASMRMAERAHEFGVGVRRLMADEGRAVRRLVAEEIAEEERANRASVPPEPAPRRARRWWGGRRRGERS